MPLPYDLEWKSDAYGKERRALYRNGIYVGCIMSMGLGKPWRAWLMINDEGDRVGKDQWPTDADARDALVAEAARIISAHKL